MSMLSATLASYAQEAAEGLDSKTGSALLAIGLQLAKSPNNIEVNLANAIFIGVREGYDAIAADDGLAVVCAQCGVRHPA